MNPDLLAKAKSLGFSDRQIANLTGRGEAEVRTLRKQLGLVPSYRLVDTCAAEFEPTHPITTRAMTAAMTRSRPRTGRRS